MILIDVPRPVRYRRFRRGAHLMSDLVGPPGTVELLDFGRGIGLELKWLQHRGEPHEHFDVFDGAIHRAVDAGAVIVYGKDLVVRCIWPKRIAAGQPVSDEMRAAVARGSVR